MDAFVLRLDENGHGRLDESAPCQAHPPRLSQGLSKTGDICASITSLGLSGRRCKSSRSVTRSSDATTMRAALTRRSSGPARTRSPGAPWLRTLEASRETESRLSPMRAAACSLFAKHSLVLPHPFLRTPDESSLDRSTSSGQRARLSDAPSQGPDSKGQVRVGSHPRRPSKWREQWQMQASC